MGYYRGFHGEIEREIISLAEPDFSVNIPRVKLIQDEIYGQLPVKFVGRLGIESPLPDRYPQVIRPDYQP